MSARFSLIGVPSVAGCRAETAEVIDQHRGPAAIREALAQLHRGYTLPRPYDDLGDIAVSDDLQQVLTSLEHRVVELRRAAAVPLILGGAHTITVGTLRALKKVERDYSVVYFDAHPDMMPREDLNYGSSIFHAIKEQVVDPSRFVIVGGRQIEIPEAEVMARYGVQNIPPYRIQEIGAAAVLAEIKARCPPPYFLSIDLDVIDPSFAPGVSAPQWLGMSPQEVFYLARELVVTGQVVGVDVVELSPARDRDCMTARLAARLVHELGMV